MRIFGRKFSALVLAVLCMVVLVLAAPAAAFASAGDDGALLTVPSDSDTAEISVSGKAINGIETIDDLKGHNIGVQTGVLYEEVEYKDGLSIKDYLEGSGWLYYKMPNDMIPALTTGKIDAYLIEEVGFYAQRFERPELVRLAESAGYCDFCVIIGENSKQSKYYDQLQEFIAAKKADGWLDDLYDYWVKNWNPNTCHIRTTPTTTGENGTVTIAIEGGYEPFSFESDGKFSGYDVEFMMNFCAAYGYQWDFKAMEFDSIATGCLAGKYDFGMNIVYDEERADASVLTDPYYRCDIVFVLEGENEAAMGFFEKLAYSFNKTFIRDNRWKLFVQGIGTTMQITVCSIVFGTVFGFLMYLWCRHGNKFANKVTSIFNGFIQGVPTVVFLMILSFIIFANSYNVNWISILGFTLIFGCGMYDMLCVGCNAIPKGQTEASRALGYSDRQCFFKIILPQAARHFLPIYRNDVVDLIKETSVVGYVAVMDLTKMCDLVRSRTYEPFFGLIAITIMYFVMEYLFIFIVRKIELGIDPTHRDEAKILKGIKEWE